MNLHARASTMPFILVALAACGGSQPNVNFANGEGSMHWQFERIARPALEEGVQAQHVLLEIRDPSGSRTIDTHITENNCVEAQPGGAEVRMRARCWWSNSGAEAEVFEVEEDECALRTRVLSDGAAAETPNATDWNVLESVPCPPRADLPPPPPPPTEEAAQVDPAAASTAESSAATSAPAAQPAAH
ncbi:MAG: hypothetical protein IPK60_09075 [Sandaracinaceae bacterium]|jgi:hypothetical protein|nr:hypothetical protein [Sandaracinaceae bacterium]